MSLYEPFPLFCMINHLPKFGKDHPTCTYYKNINISNEKPLLQVKNMLFWLLFHVPALGSAALTLSGKHKEQYVPHLTLLAHSFTRIKAYTQ